MAFKLRSGNDGTIFKKTSSTPMKFDYHGSSGPRTSSTTSRNKYEAANITENPAIKHNTMFQGDYLGEGGWDQTGWSKANYLKHPMYLDKYDKDGDGKLNKKEMKKAGWGKKGGDAPSYMSFRKEVKKNKQYPHLMQEQANAGHYQVQDKWGDWHTMNQKGEPIGASSGYSEQGKAWRKGELWEEQTNVVPQPKTVVNPYSSVPQEETVTVENVGANELEDSNNNLNPNAQRQQVNLQTNEDANVSFGEAFKNARAGEGYDGVPQKTFTWKGKEYHSRRADETPDAWAKKFEVNLDEVPGAKLGPQPSED